MQQLKGFFSKKYHYNFLKIDMSKKLKIITGASGYIGKVLAKELNSDLHASSEYRAHLIGVMAKKAVAGCK